MSTKPIADESPRESSIEKKFVAYVESKGGKCVKLRGPRGFPDRLITHPDLISVYFVEFKRRWEVASDAQIEWAQDLQACGLKTYLHYSYYGAVAVYEAQARKFK